MLDAGDVVCARRPIGADIAFIGRGGTTFAASAASGMDFDPSEALKLAALVSIRMETPGPFVGTLNEVLARVR